MGVGADRLDHRGEVAVPGVVEEGLVEGPVGVEVLLEQLDGHLAGGLDPGDDGAVGGVRLLEGGEQRIHVLEGSAERGGLDDASGIEQLGHLLGVEHRRDDVASQRHVLHQPGALEGHHRLPHRGRGDLEVSGQPVDAQPRPRRPARLQQPLQDQLLDLGAQHLPSHSHHGTPLSSRALRHRLSRRRRSSHGRAALGDAPARPAPYRKCGCGADGSLRPGTSRPSTSRPCTSRPGPVRPSAPLVSQHRTMPSTAPLTPRAPQGSRGAWR